MNTVATSHEAAPSFGRFLTIDQVAALLSVCRRTIQREIQRGRFPQPAKIGRSVRFSLQDVEAYAQSLRPAGQ
jgi:excisionase family DNA binding protein